MPTYTTLPVADLQTFEKNPRRGIIEEIAKSLVKHGQYRSIVVNAGTLTGRPNEVLAGNHTLMAAKHLGWESIDVGVVDVDEDTARSIVAADNHLSDLGGYDSADLHALLSSLDSLDGTGYEFEDLALLVEQSTGDGVWGDALDGLPTGGPSVFTRTFSLTEDQAEAVDRAIAVGKEKVAGGGGNANGAALAWVCERAGL